MKCPSCNYNLKQYKYHGLVVDICLNCKGIWFDPGEMKEYIEFLLKDRNDVPNAKIELNKEIVTIDHISEALKSCPHCNEPMRKFNYAYDSNITLDRCPACNGIWTDGEEIYKLAVYIKGNPRLDALGNAIIEEKRKAEELNDLIEVSRSLTRNAGAWIFLPKIILPLGDDTKTTIIPGVVFSIIAVNIMVFLYQSLFVKNVSLFFKEYGLIPSVILSGKRYFSSVSSMFLHGGLLHLIGNMFFFWIFADNVEEALGHLRFIVFYLLLGFFASMFHVLTNMHSNMPAIGASGAIAGVMGAYFVLYPHARIETLLINQIIDVPAYLYLGGWILLQVLFGMIYLSLKVHSGIGWFAHIGGFVSGLILMWFYKRNRNRNTINE